MKVLALGTNHDIQEKDYNSTNEFRGVIDCLAREWEVEVLMEEWTPVKGSAGDTDSLQTSTFNGSTRALQTLRVQDQHSALRPYGSARNGDGQRRPTSGPGQA